jgi:hypothetical protein
MRGLSSGDQSVTQFLRESNPKRPIYRHLHVKTVHNRKASVSRASGSLLLSWKLHLRGRSIDALFFESVVHSKLCDEDFPAAQHEEKRQVVR